MKFDVDHSTPYYRSIFERVPEEIMTDNSNVMKSLSTYHKRQHFLFEKCGVIPSPFQARVPEECSQ